ncbi:TetR/AcrR family transcriptional regulator [Actinomadura rupiterrae]|uniref:TetR/AcrR family transcriptional regulator n=1 Tax=Actinomadura rupiterrae TaxID=559627 RepID=UPI0020A58BB3|nr:TetR/AcrR family transcriptional regulator [Actinomadura rupiterrae]MCP2338664.1 AcrR family transcriptional regulator [Actinomadura rupiterrae]
MRATTSGARSRDRILRAAIELCGERSYSAVTMEAVAARAAVGKPTVYRWWPSKGALLLDALLSTVGEGPFLYPDTGDLPADLRSWARALVDLTRDPAVRRILTGVLGSVQHDPELAAAVRSEICAALSRRNLERVRDAVDRGEVPPLDPEVLDDLVAAPIWYYLLVTGRPLTHERTDRLVDAAVTAALTH